MHVVIINGSPRAQAFSNTNEILNAFCEGLLEKNVSYERYSISDKGQWEDAKAAFYKNTKILIALPLYVECIPGLLMEFLETLSPKEYEDTEIAFLLQSGFAEGCQLRCGEEFLRRLPAKLNCIFGGVLVKGDNFSIRILEKEEKVRITGPYKAMGRLYGENGHFFFPEAKKFTGYERFPFYLRWVLQLVFSTFAKKTFQQAAEKLGCTEPLTKKIYGSRDTI